MEWSDEGALLSSRPHGESSAIIEVFTANHGRHAGVVRGGAGRRLSPVLQPGAQLAVSWRARLEDHIGSFTVEPIRGRAAGIMNDRLALSGLNAICAILSYGLPERAAYPALYERTQSLLDLLQVTPAWPLAYLQWEVTFLEDMGFGLDLSRCAVTGAENGLKFVSPRSGRAVTEEGAGAWADRLLPLPPCLLGEGDGDNAEIAVALHTTGHFLENNLPTRFAGQVFPPARGRLVDLLGRYSEAGTNTN